MSKNEMWVLFDKNHNPLNKVVPRYTALSKDEYSTGVHVWLKSNGKYLIFKRAATKRLFPGYYEMIGGGIDGFDDPKETAVRELEEESGIATDQEELKLVFMSRVDYGDGIIYPEHTYVYMVENDNISLEDIKIEEGKNCCPSFKSKNEILQLIEDKVFIPVVNYKDKIQKLF